MAEKNSVLIKTSRYVSGGVTEVNANALEWWERTNISAGTDDTVYVVEARFANRLDLIAAIYLGEPRYWWIIAQYNNILDPSSEVTTGVILYIPSVSRIQNLLSGAVGGTASTRTVPTSILPIV